MQILQAELLCAPPCYFLHPPVHHYKKSEYRLILCLAIYKASSDINLSDKFFILLSSLNLEFVNKNSTILQFIFIFYEFNSTIYYFCYILYIYNFTCKFIRKIFRRKKHHSFYFRNTFNLFNNTKIPFSLRYAGCGRTVHCTIPDTAYSSSK